MRVAPLLLAAALVVACSDDTTTSDTGAGGSAAGGTNGTTTTTGATGGFTGAGGGDVAVWNDLAPLLEPLQEHAVVALDGEVIVLGGFDAQAQVVDRVEAYDPDTDTWRSLAPLPAPRHHVNAAVVDGRIYVAGALTGLNFAATDEVWSYDPALDQWETLAPMPAGIERGGAAVAVVGPTIILMGGLRGASAVTEVHAYDTITEDWIALPSLPAPRDHLVAGAYDSTVYAIGGRDTSIEAIAGDVFSLALAGNSWSALNGMPTPRGGAAATTLADDRIVVLGGEGNLDAPTGVFEEVEAYDPETDAWRSLSPMTIPRHGLGAAVVDGVIFMPGGATTQAFGAVDTHQSLVIP